MDECSLRADACPLRSKCHQTVPGDYSCVCESGFEHQSCVQQDCLYMDCAKDEKGTVYINPYTAEPFPGNTCRSLMVRKKLTLLRESIPIRKWKLSHCTLCMLWMKWGSLGHYGNSFMAWQILIQLRRKPYGKKEVDILKGIHSNKEMKAISSYIMYVMHKMELFHNTIHIRCLFRQYKDLAVLKSLDLPNFCDIISLAQGWIKRFKN